MAKTANSIKIKPKKKGQTLIAKAQKPTAAWLKANGLIIMGVRDGKYILGEDLRGKGNPKYR